MKYSLVALAVTSIFGGASARGHLHNRRHNHYNSHPIYNSNGTSTCIPQCTTYVTSYWVDYTPPPPPPSPPATVTVVPVPEHTSSVPVTYAPIVTPAVTTCPTPGVYTISAKTVSLTSTSYLCVPTTTPLCPGEHTVGGFTTVVAKKTTVTCPVATVETCSGVPTSKVILTTYICPTPGTYTINPITTTITATTTVPCEIPSVTSYPPGIYTAPEFTTTITETNKVVTCPLYTSTSTVEVVPLNPTPTPYHVEKPKTTEVPYHDEKPQTTDVPYHDEKPQTTEAPHEKPTTSAAPVPYAPKTTKVPQGYKSTGNNNDNDNYISKNNIWAITYSQYNDDGSCKCAEDVDADIKDIAYKGFKSLRLYSTDCNGLQTVGESCAKYGLKIVIGVFIKAGGVHTADSQVDDIIAWNRWDLIEMFVVGNEAVFQGFCSASDLAAYIDEVKCKIKEAGYNGPVTTTEPLNIYQENDNYKLLCAACDVAGINIHPYFNPDVTCDQAGSFLSQELKIIEDLCGKEGYVLEAGWPSEGQPNGKAIPGVDEQKTAIKSIEDCEPNKVVIFSYRNDYWKTPGAFNVEQHFGCSQLF